jgi:hypothetical protein
MMKSTFHIAGFHTVQHFRVKQVARGIPSMYLTPADYELIKTLHAINGVTDEGITDNLDAYFSAATQSTTWYKGLIDGAGSQTLAATDTLASHAGWSEFSSYSGNRQQWVCDTAAAKSITNTTVSQFTMTAAGTVHGIFVCTVATGTSGILWSTAPFPSEQAVNIGDVFKTTYTVTGAPA